MPCSRALISARLFQSIQPFSIQFAILEKRVLIPHTGTLPGYALILDNVATAACHYCLPELDSGQATLPRTPAEGVKLWKGSSAFSRHSMAQPLGVYVDFDRSGACTQPQVTSYPVSTNEYVGTFLALESLKTLHKKQYGTRLV